jgi:DNA-binding NarL/FixJ family response regulator
MANHTATALSCNTSQKSQLERLESSGKTPQKIALRAQIILKAVAGEGNSAIAKALHISRPTVSLWRNRFTQAGVANQHEKRKSEASSRGDSGTWGGFTPRWRPSMDFERSR